MAVSFNLTTTSAKLTSGYGETDGFGEKWRLSLTVTLDPFEDRLTLKTGEDQSRLFAHLGFVHTEVGKRGFLDNGDEQRAACVGVLHFYPAHERNFVDVPPMLRFDIGLNEDQMAEMMTLARLGRFPTSATVWLESHAGIEYSSPSVGGEKIWDNEANPHVPITSIQFEIPLKEPEEEKEIDPQPLPGQPKTEVGADLLPEIQKISRAVGWILPALAVIGFVLVLVLRH